MSLIERKYSSRLGWKQFKVGLYCSIICILLFIYLFIVFYFKYKFCSCQNNLRWILKQTCM